MLSWHFSSWAISSPTLTWTHNSPLTCPSASKGCSDVQVGFLCLFSKTQCFWGQDQETLMDLSPQCPSGLGQ